jgi:hypothetical protein
MFPVNRHALTAAIEASDGGYQLSQTGFIGRGKPYVNTG